MVRHILVPLDGSALAETILPHVRELATATGASVTLLGVVDPLVPHDEVAAPGPVDIRRELALIATHLQDYLDEVADRLVRTGVRVHARVVTGTVATRIVEAGAVADLIAMTTHGRSGLDRLVHGSVADLVVRHATVPVLLVRPGVEVHEPEVAGAAAGIFP